MLICDKLFLIAVKFLIGIIVSGLIVLACAYIDIFIGIVLLILAVFAIYKIGDAILNAFLDRNN